MTSKTHKGGRPATPVAWEDVEKPSYDIESLRQQFRKRLVKDSGIGASLRNGAGKGKSRQGSKSA